jgi:protein CpxP
LEIKLLSFPALQLTQISTKNNKNNMKKLMMICGLMLGIAGFANAQQGGGQGRMMMKPEERVKQLDEKLKLSDDQKTKLTTVFTEQAETMKKMREEMQGGDRDAMREKMQKMRADNDAKVTAVLTDDQKKTYETWQKEQRAEMEKRRQGGGNN